MLKDFLAGFDDVSGLVMEAMSAIDDYFAGDEREYRLSWLIFFESDSKSQFNRIQVGESVDAISSRVPFFLASVLQKNKSALVEISPDPVSPFEDTGYLTLCDRRQATKIYSEVHEAFENFSARAEESLGFYYAEIELAECVNSKDSTFRLKREKSLARASFNPGERFLNERREASRSIIEIETDFCS